jgi:hypothetical protein
VATTIDFQSACGCSQPLGVALLIPLHAHHLSIEAFLSLVNRSAFVQIIARARQVTPQLSSSSDLPRREEDPIPHSFSDKTASCYYLSRSLPIFLPFSVTATKPHVLMLAPLLFGEESINHTGMRRRGSEAQW